MYNFPRTYHFLNGLFVVVAVYLIYDSLTYLYTAYKTVYDQSSLLVTIFILFATSWLSPFGVALLFIPILNISRKDKRISIMLLLNVGAIALSFGIVSFAVPMLSLFLLALLAG